MSDIPVLSLIVAVYNGEKFLSAFFDSINCLLYTSDAADDLQPV